MGRHYGRAALGPRGVSRCHRGAAGATPMWRPAPLPPAGRPATKIGCVADGCISVFLAEDNLLVGEGGRALLALQPDLEVVGVVADFDELVTGAEAARLLRKRHPGTGVGVLSQYDDPEYAISLLGEGSAGYVLPPSGPHRPRRPVGARSPGCRDGRLDARSGDRGSAHPPRARVRPDAGGGGPALEGRRGPTDQGHRRGRRSDARGRRRRGRAALPQDRPAGEHPSCRPSISRRTPCRAR